MKTKVDRFILIYCLGILTIHLLLFLAGFRVIRIDYYFQFMDHDLMHKDFWNTVLYFHFNPPGLSLLFYLFDLVSNGHSYRFLQIFLPLMQCLSFYLFYKATSAISLKYRKLICSVLFFNPLMFIYFNYPFYCTYIFTASCFLLYVLFSSYSNSKKLLLFTLIFAFNCLLRSSWHIFIIGAFLLPFMVKSGFKKSIIPLLILLIPFSVYIKNYAIFGKFTSSTCLGINLCTTQRYVPNTPSNSILRVGTLSRLDKYKDYISEQDPMIQKFKNVPSLNLEPDSKNNIRYILVSDLYMSELKKFISWPLMAKSMVYGYFRFLMSPSSYDILYSYSSFKKGLPAVCYDIFNFFHFTNKYNDLEISPYTVLYSLLWIWLILNFRKFNFELRWLTLLCFLFTCIYFSIDPYESNRMRFEIEPVYYFLFLYALSDLLRSRKRTERPLAA